MSGSSELRRHRDGVLDRMRGIAARVGPKAGMSVNNPIFGPRTLTIDVRLVDPTQAKDAFSMAQPLSLDIGARDIHVHAHEGYIRYEIILPEQMWQDVTLSNVGASIGVSSTMSSATFSIEPPIVLVIGESGSGKTNLVHAIMVQMMRSMSPDELKIGLVDPHGQMERFEGKSHLIGPPAKHGDEIRNVIGYFYNQLKERAELGSDEAMKLPMLWLIADECPSADVLGVKGAVNEENLRMVQALVKEGRKFNIRTLLVTQKPTEADMSGILSIATVRYVGRLSKSVASNLANDDAAAPHLLTGKGDFYYTGPTHTTRFQVARVTESDYDSLEEGVYRSWPAYLGESDEDFAPSSIGRPRAELDPKIVGEYIVSTFSRREAKDRFGHGQALHKRYVDFARIITEVINDK